MNSGQLAADPQLRRVLDKLLAIRAEMIAREETLGSVGDRPKSRCNLLHYLALRQRDMRPIQETLARQGLSSLGRCEAHTLASVDAVIHVLARLLGVDLALPPSVRAPGFDEGPAILEANARALFGSPPPNRAVRIMVTLPSEAGDAPSFVSELVAQGTNAVRINCAHDDVQVWGRMVEHVRRAARESGRRCIVHFDLAGPKLRTGATVRPIPLRAGDEIVITRSAGPEASNDAPPRIPCTLPIALERVQTGERVWLDDGKLGGFVEKVSKEGVSVRINYARKGHHKLLADRGINFPESAIDINGFTEKDRSDLAFVARHADSVGLSFAQRAADVRAVQQRLAELGAPRIGLVLKIETRRGFEALPRLLLETFGEHPVGVMIARGDLALEVGYERLAEVQEEVLWLCEAAHVPVIWATQVLETLSKNGMPTRAEITDAAMSQRAECVMLNKGAHIVDSVRILNDILQRMEAHQRKKSATLRPLRVSASPDDESPKR
ncbi:MAG: pyruvate kinase [Polyangiaceae bacterium]|jgi:pyruvate kinase